MKPLETIGATPLIEVEGVLVKLECSNPGGSVKDRVAQFLLAEAAKRGELQPGDTIVEATSGNTGIAMAMVGRALGHPVVIYMPEHMSVERRQLIEAHGAEVRLTPHTGGFELPIELRDAFRGRAGYYVPDQFGNADNTRCHFEHTGRELLDQLAERGQTELGAFVAGVGTGGTLMGVGRALRTFLPGTRIVAVEPTESAVLGGGPAGEHGIMGIGDGFVPDLVDLYQVDEVIAVSTEEAHATSERIRREHGYCVGRSAGANLAAALRLKERGSVATVWPDCSDRYVSVGLEPPSSEEVQCPLREVCAARSQALLGS